MGFYDQLIYVQAHCDSRVLHKPENCKYCDMYPEAQQQRLALGILFTDDSPTDNPGKIPCPAIEARGWDHLNGWGGNQPHQPDTMTEEQIEYFDRIERFSSKVMYGDTVSRHKGLPREI